jgi:hypothetical protein
MQWCSRRQHWLVGEWRKRVWTDECKIEYDPNPGGHKVRYHPGEQLNEKHLKPTFKSGRTMIQVWGAFQYGSRCNLVLVRKRNASERTTPTDKLGMNTKQFCEEIIESNLAHYWQSLEDPEDSYLIEDNLKVHQNKLSKEYRAAYGIKKDDWPAGSPDLNPIENAWRMLKSALKKRWSSRERRPHSAHELFIAAQEEWEALSQSKLDKLVDSLPSRVEACLKANGGHTKW